MPTVTLDAILNQSIGQQIGIRLYSIDLSDNPATQVGSDIFLNEVFSGSEMYRNTSVSISVGNYFVRIYPVSSVDTIDESGDTAGSNLIIFSDSTHCTLGYAGYDNLVSKLDAAISIKGTGADQVTILIEDDSIPEPGVSVWITSDSSGTNVIAGSLTTNSSGEVTFLLNNGSTYYLWAQKEGKISIQGQLFTAVKD